MKRAIKGVFALFIVALLPATSVFARDNVLDYANSIGQVDNSDTVNYVVEATSDGGYVVGGQVLVCVKRKMSSTTPIIVEQAGEDDEVVPAENCEGLLDDGGSKIVTQAIRRNDRCLREPDLALLGSQDDDDDYTFCLVGRDYIAKFKKDGTREWLTAITDSDEPVAVGETGDDYRLITDGGRAHIFAKSGAYANQAINFFEDDYYEIAAAKIERDGSMFVRYSYNFVKYDKNGNKLAVIPTEEEEDNDDPYERRWLSYYNNDFVVMNGEIYMTREKRGPTSDEYSDYIEEVIKVSKDLSTVTVLASGDEDEEIYVISSDAEGNFMTYSYHYHKVFSSGDHSAYYIVPDDPKLTSYDKDGNILAQKEVNLDNEDDIYNVGEGLALPGYVVNFTTSNRLIRFDKYLEPVFVYDYNDHEWVAGSVILDDGSVVVVGNSSESTENYQVSGRQNGIQMRLGIGISGDEDEPVVDGVNPATFDGVWYYAGAGVVVLTGGAWLAKKMSARR